MMNVNLIKDKVQKEACQTIIDNDGRGLLAMATGTGKSKIPIDYIKLKGYTRIALLVPTQNLRDNNWYEEFIKWDAEDIWNNHVTRLCYASASKLKGGNYELVIMDEVHNITELNSEFFDNNEVKDIIALSATHPEDELKRWLLQKLRLKITYSLSLDEAVELGLVSPFHITIVYTNLNSSIKNVTAGSKKKPFKVTEENAYRYLESSINKLIHKTGRTEKEGGLLEALILKRMHLIYNLPSKSAFAVRLLRKIKSREDRVILFCGSKEQADNVCEHTYYSGVKTDTLQRFKNKEIDVMSCVDKINEGENIPDLDKIIIVQLNSNEKDLIQRIGRAIRFREGHIADVYIIVCKGTQDEVWLKKAIEKFDKSKITKKLYTQYML